MGCPLTGSPTETDVVQGILAEVDIGKDGRISYETELLVKTPKPSKPKLQLAKAGVEATVPVKSPSSGTAALVVTLSGRPIPNGASSKAIPPGRDPRHGAKSISHGRN